MTKSEDLLRHVIERADLVAESSDGTRYFLLLDIDGHHLGEMMVFGSATEDVEEDDPPEDGDQDDDRDSDNALNVSRTPGGAWIYDEDIEPDYDDEADNGGLPVPHDPSEAAFK